MFLAGLMWPLIWSVMICKPKLSQQYDKHRSPVRTELKNMHRIKSYGQNKIVVEILAISFVFWPHLRSKMGGARGGASRPPRELNFFLVHYMTKCNGKMQRAHWILTFWFFWTPLTSVLLGQYRAWIVHMTLGLYSKGQHCTLARHMESGLKKRLAK